MPSLQKFLRLKAGVRATCQLESQGKGRLLPRFKSEKHNSSHKGKQPVCPPKPVCATGPSSSRPTFVNSFVSAFSSSAGAGPTSAQYSASTLDLKHGKDRGLTASEAISRVISIPSVHGPFRQSSQLLIDGSDPDKSRALSEKVLFVVPRRTADDVLGKATNRGGDSIDRSSRRAEKGSSSRYALSTLKQELWKEKRWRNLSSEAREELSGVVSEGRFTCESRGEGLELTEGGAKSTNIRSEALTVRRSVCEEEILSCKGEKVEEIGQRIRSTRRKDAEKTRNMGTVGLQPLLNRAVVVPLHNGSAILPRVGEVFSRALHDLSLAGDGMTLDRSRENDNAESQSDQAAGHSNYLKLLSGVCNLPHPDKIKTGGEDAYFICPDKQVVGVADGVGGWADLGIDAGEYARELMAQALIAVRQEPQGCIDPSRVLERAHAMTKCRGSSTACILALSDSVLEAANLGDSGFVIVRNCRTVFKSPAQQHQFNIPFQLESGGSDPPSAAQVFSIQVSVGDVIVAGTDGLFDNLYDNELTTVVVQAARSGVGPQVTAQNIADLARERAQDRNRQTPFSTAAQDAGYRFYGGKMDDITVIVSYITNSKVASSAA